MPNQRKKSKVHLGGYYEAALKNRLAAQAEREGITLSALVEEILMDAVGGEEALKDAPNSTPAVAAYEKKVLADVTGGDGGARPAPSAGGGASYKSVRLVRRQRVSSRRSKKA